MTTAKVKLGDWPAPPRGPVTAHGPSPKNIFFAWPVRAQGSISSWKLKKCPGSCLGLALPDRIPNGPVWFLFWFLSGVVEFWKHVHPSEGADVGGGGTANGSHWMSHPVMIRLRNVEEC
jgi:hypothetical protein